MNFFEGVFCYVWISRYDFTFKNKEQAETIFPFVKDFLDIEECEDWRNALELKENVIKVEYDVYIPTYVYEDLVRELCQEIAAMHPDYEFVTSAGGGDDDGIFTQDENSFLKDGKFEHIIRISESPEVYEDDYEDYTETELVITIRGKLVDGKMKFTKTRKRKKV